MKNAKMILKVSELLGEDHETVAESLYISRVERASTMEELSLIKKEIRDNKGIPGTRVWAKLEKRCHLLSLIEVQKATTKDEIARAFLRLVRSMGRYSEAYDLAIYKMTEILEEEKRK